MSVAASVHPLGGMDHDAQAHVLDLATPCVWPAVALVTFMGTM
jgi:hypothetical protein